MVSDVKKQGKKWFEFESAKLTKKILEKMFNVIKKVVFLQPHFARDEHRGVAQLASALAWGARGRKFESFHPDEKKREMISSLFFSYQITGYRG